MYIGNPRSQEALKLTSGKFLGNIEMKSPHSFLPILGFSFKAYIEIIE